MGRAPGPERPDSISQNLLRQRQKPLLASPKTKFIGLVKRHGKTDGQ